MKNMQVNTIVGDQCIDSQDKLFSLNKLAFHLIEPVTNAIPAVARSKL
jgi:hypothetical protein